MIPQKSRQMMNERMAEICGRHGIETAPLVSEYGPFTGQFVCPSDWSADQMADVMSEFANVDWVSQQEGIWLGVYYDELGEEFTEEEARTYIFDVDKSLCLFVWNEIKKHREENVIELKESWKNGPDNVYLTLCYEFFDAILDGRKKIEYREYKECWVKRLLGPNAKYVTFQRGYKKDAPKMVFKVDHYELQDEDGRLYSPWDIPSMGTPETILIHLSHRVL